MIVPVKTRFGGYDVVIERGILNSANRHLNLKRKVLVVTDSGVPEEYSRIISDMAEESLVLVIPEGESSKNIDNYKMILEALVCADFTRSDCIVAVGGGVVGDLAGFTAATYMRGIDFYNVPTTVLSQVDSSVGGKTAIDFSGYKNTVGSFYPPKCVIIDPDTLKTLDARQVSNGLCEALKMAATCDSELFSFFEKGDVTDNICEIITRSIKIKRKIVESDERETGLRRVLNFGHTLGHAIESNNSELLHGECVGIGMLYMCSLPVRERIKNALIKLGLPVTSGVSFDKISDAVIHDKKSSGDTITTVYVDEIGSYEFKEEQISRFLEDIKGEWGK